MPFDQDLLARFRELPEGSRLLDAVPDLAGVWLVGGAVRDLLLGAVPLDVDVTVEDDGVEIARELARRLGGEVTVHDRFGTATVRAPELSFDVAQARRERYPQPGALPDVEPAGLDEDLARRDFTANALALGLAGEVAGELRTAPGALDDLQARQLRVLHDHSFDDDPTRLLRLARYAARLGFGIEPQTERLARSAISAGAPATVSPGRMGEELRLLAAEDGALAALDIAERLGLAQSLHADFRPDRALAERALGLLPAEGRRDLLVLAASCLSFAPDALTAWLDDLECTARDRDTVVAAGSGAQELAERLISARRPSELRRAAADRPLETIALAGALGAAEPARRWLEGLRHVTLDISGQDLLDAGVPEGPALGRALDRALALKLDGAVHGRDEELAGALEAAGEDSGGV